MDNPFMMVSNRPPKFESARNERSAISPSLFTYSQNAHAFSHFVQHIVQCPIQLAPLIVSVHTKTDNYKSEQARFITDGFHFFQASPQLTKNVFSIITDKVCVLAEIWSLFTCSRFIVIFDHVSYFPANAIEWRKNKSVK